MHMLLHRNWVPRRLTVSCSGTAAQMAGSARMEALGWLTACLRMSTAKYALCARPWTSWQ